MGNCGSAPPSLQHSESPPSPPPSEEHNAEEKGLVFQDVHFDPKALQQVFVATQRSAVDSITFSSCTFTKKAAALLVKLFQTHSHWQKIAFEFNLEDGLDTETRSKLTEAWAVRCTHTTNLSIVGFGNNCLSRKALSGIFDERRSSLKVLCLSSVSLHGETMTYLAGSLRDGELGGALEELFLPYCGIGNEDLKHLASVLMARAPRLRKLSLSGNELCGTEALESLTGLISHLQDLEGLSLSENRDLFDERCIAKESSTPTLSNTFSSSDLAIERFVDASVRNHPKMKKLRLGKTNVGDRTSALLFRALASSSTNVGKLQDLSLMNCNFIKFRGLAVLEQYLPSMIYLRTFDLRLASGTGFHAEDRFQYQQQGKHCNECLLRALSNNYSLVDVQLPDPYHTDLGEARRACIAQRDFLWKLKSRNRTIQETQCLLVLAGLSMDRDGALVCGENSVVPAWDLDPAKDFERYTRRTPSAKRNCFPDRPLRSGHTFLASAMYTVLRTNLFGPHTQSRKA